MLLHSVSSSCNFGCFAISSIVGRGIALYLHFFFNTSKMTAGFSLEKKGVKSSHDTTKNKNMSCEDLTPFLTPFRINTAPWLEMYDKRIYNNSISKFKDSGNTLIKKAF